MKAERKKEIEELGRGLFGLAVLIGVGFYIYSCMEDFTKEVEAERKASQAAAEAAAAEAEEWWNSLSAEEQQAEIESYLGRVNAPTAPEIENRKIKERECNRKYEKAMDKCLWNGLSKAFCEASMQSAKRECLK